MTNPYPMTIDKASGKELRGYEHSIWQDGCEAGKKEERDSWLLKTDPEKARDAFTKDIILRSRAQALKEVGELLDRSILAEFIDETGLECVSLDKKIVKALKRGEMPGE